MASFSVFSFLSLAALYKLKSMQPGRRGKNLRNEHLKPSDETL